MILIIDNEHCRSLEQLKGYFDREWTPYDSVCKVLITRGRNGTIAGWLQENSESNLASRVKSIPDNLGDAEYFAELKSAITGKDMHYANYMRPSFSDCFRVENIEINDSVDSHIEASVRLTVQLRTNENYNLRMCTDLNEASECINPSRYRLGETIVRKITLELKESEKPDKTELFADDTLIGTTESFVEKISNVSFKMIRVKHGSFWMGYLPGSVSWPENEQRYHVTLTDDYYIGETVVTKELWQSVMGEHPEWDGSKFPVTNISREQATAFIKALNLKTKKKYRLPTEAEWEFAAKGGVKSKGYKYSGSDNLDDVGWYGNNSDKRVHSVKEKESNELGIYDMSGNVDEMCLDIFGELPKNKVSNPIGALHGDRYMIKGGCYGRYFCEPTNRKYSLNFNFSGSESVGFRLVLSKAFDADSIMAKYEAEKKSFEQSLKYKPNFEDYFTDPRTKEYYKSRYEDISEPLEEFVWNSVNNEYDIKKRYLGVKVNGKWGWINPQCEFVIPAEYDHGFVICAESIIVLCKNGVYGAINIDTSEIAISFKYSRIHHLFKNIFAAEAHNLFAIVMPNNQYISKHIYKDFAPTSVPYIYRFVMPFAGEWIIDVRTGERVF